MTSHISEDFEERLSILIDHRVEEMVEVLNILNIKDRIIDEVLEHMISKADIAKIKIYCICKDEGI